MEGRNAEGKVGHQGRKDGEGSNKERKKGRKERTVCSEGRGLLISRRDVPKEGEPW